MRDPARQGGAGRRRQWSACAVLAAASMLTACAEPSGSYGDFATKVRQSATDAQSAIASAQLMARQLLHGRSTLAYADTVVSNAEDDVNSIQTSLDSRQPPDAASIKLRQAFDNVLQAASTAAEDLRIAVRRSDRAAIDSALDEAAKALQRLQKYGR